MPRTLAIGRTCTATGRKGVGTDGREGGVMEDALRDCVLWYGGAIRDPSVVVRQPSGDPQVGRDGGREGGVAPTCTQKDLHPCSRL